MLTVISLQSSCPLVACRRMVIRQMSKHNKTILLIDDEASAREFIHGILQVEGYNVLEAADFDEAMAIHQQHQGEIKMLLTDVSLPGKNGYELAQTLIQIDPKLKVVFTSGPAGAEVCKFYGMPTSDVHFLGKPFEAADLVQRVRQVLESAGHFFGTASM
jgi:DNA-binding response OmpR family regulator